MKEARVGAGGAAIALSRGVASVVGLANSVVLARGLGAADRGIVAGAISVLYLLPIVFSAGSPLLVRRQADPAVRRDCYRWARSSIPLLVLVSTLIAIPLVLIGISYWEFRTAISVGLCVALAPISVLWLIDQSWLLASGRFGPVAVVQILPSVVALMVAATATVLGALTVAVALSAYQAGQLLTVMYTRSQVKTAVRTVPVSSSNAKRCAYRRAAYPLWASSLAESLRNRADVVIAVPVLGAAAAGQYVVAATIGTVTVSLSYALGASIFNEAAGSDMGAKIMTEAIREGLVAGAAAALVVTPLLPAVVPRAFGPEFSAAVGPAMVMSLSGVLLLPYLLAIYVCTAQARGWLATQANVSAATVTTLGVAVLGSVGGVVAAALAPALGAVAGMAVIGVRYGMSAMAVAPDRESTRRVLERLGAGRTSFRSIGR